MSLTEKKLEELEREAQDNLAHGPPSDFGPQDVLELVAEVRRLRAAMDDARRELEPKKHATWHGTLQEELAAKRMERVDALELLRVALGYTPRADVKPPALPPCAVCGEPIRPDESFGQLGPGRDSAEAAHLRCM